MTLGAGGSTCNSSQMQARSGDLPAEPTGRATLVSELQDLTRRLVTVALDSLGSVPEVTMPQMRLLLAVRERGAASGLELARAVGTSAASVSRHGHRLVRAGLLGRGADPTNRRVVRFHLTREGERAVHQVLQARAEALATMVEHLDDEQAAQVATDLRGMIHRPRRREDQLPARALPMTSGAADAFAGMVVRGQEHARADAARNHAALLDAAAQVLAVAPRSSLAEVATHAGLGRATLYRHFESREALLAAIRAEALSRAASALADADLHSCDTREAVRRAAAVLVPLGVRFRILLSDGSDADTGFLAARDEALSPLWEVLAREVETGEISAAADPAWPRLVLALTLMAAVRAAGAGLIDPAEAGDMVADAFMNGFGTR